MARKLRYKITREFDSFKIQNFLRFQHGYSTKLIRTLKTTPDGILVNGEHARAVDFIHTEDLLEINIPDEKNEIEASSIEIDVVYEDEDILVVNKSPFLAMHPSHNHQGDTLANAVAYHLKQRGKECTFRAIGRLDKGTSGLVVIALNQLAACRLSGNIEKHYVALVKGKLKGNGTVDIPIYRPNPLKTLRACGYVPGAELAVTHWQVLENYEDSTLVRLDLETGRTHQIRVHMAHIGHPLAGDSFYGDFQLYHGHQLLHCACVEFSHPVTNEKMRIEVKENF